jgi:hypothetical protein
LCILHLRILKYLRLRTLYPYTRRLCHDLPIHAHQRQPNRRRPHAHRHESGRVSHALRKRRQGPHHVARRHRVTAVALLVFVFFVVLVFFGNDRRTADVVRREEARLGG